MAAVTHSFCTFRNFRVRSISLFAACLFAANARGQKISTHFFFHAGLSCFEEYDAPRPRFSSGLGILFSQEGTKHIYGSVGFSFEVLHSFSVERFTVYYNSPGGVMTGQPWIRHDVRSEVLYKYGYFTIPLSIAFRIKPLSFGGGIRPAVMLYRDREFDNYVNNQYSQHTNDFRWGSGFDLGFISFIRCPINDVIQLDLQGYTNAAFQPWQATLGISIRMDHHQPSAAVSSSPSPN